MTEYNNTEYGNITNKQKLARYLLIAGLMEFEMSKQPLPVWVRENMETAHDAMIGIIAPLEANVKNDLQKNENPHAAANDKVRYIVNNINHPAVRYFLIGQLINLEKEEEGILETEKERLENAGSFIGAIMKIYFSRNRKDERLILDSIKKIKDFAVTARSGVDWSVEYGIPRE